jgi:thiosulfate reductase cytochrome b subunit
MRAAQQRRLERLVHLAAGAVLAAYVYLPLGNAIAGVIRWVVLPMLVLSGLAMWQMARIRRAIHRRRPRVASGRVRAIGREPAGGEL